MEDHKDISKKIEELQNLEKSLQLFLSQKQEIQIGVNEVNNALEELKESGEEVYKMVSGIMIKTKKESLVSELEEKKKFFDMRVDAVEKQEQLLSEKATVLREEVTKEMAKTAAAEKEAK